MTIHEKFKESSVLGEENKKPPGKPVDQTIIQGGHLTGRPTSPGGTLPQFTYNILQNGCIKQQIISQMVKFTPLFCHKI
jgi:hypothetical protein